MDAIMWSILREDFLSRHDETSAGAADAGATGAP
jgi:hypothetical protein